MYRDIAKAHHALQPLGQRRVNPAALRQKSKHIACTLRHPQFLPADQVLAHIQRCLTGALDIQNGRVLPGEIGGKAGRVASVFLARPRHAALDHRRLVD